MRGSGDANGRRRVSRTQLAHLYVWLPRLPVARLARTSRRLGGPSVGGHGDVFSGGSPWTVTGPFFDLLVILPIDPPSILQFSAGVNPRKQG